MGIDKEEKGSVGLGSKGGVAVEEGGEEAPGRTALHKGGRMGWIECRSLSSEEVRVIVDLDKSSFV